MINSKAATITETPVLVIRGKKTKVKTGKVFD